MWLQSTGCVEAAGPGPGPGAPLFRLGTFDDAVEASSAGARYYGFAAVTIKVG